MASNVFVVSVAELLELETRKFPESQIAKAFAIRIANPESGQIELSSPDWSAGNLSVVIPAQQIPVEPPSKPEAAQFEWTPEQAKAIVRVIERAFAMGRLSAPRW